MNDTKVSWNPDIAPCKVTVEEAFEDKETNSLISGDAAEFATVESGAGREADSIFADAQTKTQRQRSVWLLMERQQRLRQVHVI